jgi:hypothetical protein
MNRKKSEIILKVGAAGGTLTLFGSKLPDGQWKFFMERNETAALDLLPEEEREGFKPISKTKSLQTIEDGFLALNKYPWFKLLPLEIHPEFFDRILKEVKQLGGPKEVERWERRLKK